MSTISMNPNSLSTREGRDGIISNQLARSQRTIPQRIRHRTIGSFDSEKASSISLREEVRRRLREGVERDHSGLYGPQLVGTIQNPLETHGRTAPLPEEDIDKLLSDIAEIKALLLCRTLLSHATLLPAALKAKSVEEFIEDPSIAHTDLRDLCLKVEQPNSQALRDACADFARGDNPEPPPPEEELEVLSTEEIFRRNLMYGDMNDMGLFSALMSGKTKKIMAAESNNLKGDSEKKSVGKRMKITICGKTIWNHASELAMARDGWLQFSIMAKDCTFEEAVLLCRNWDEFYELQTLVLWHFFPSAKWASWSQNALTEQLLRMRGDPVTNRFIDYCIMQTGNLQILVRDGKTGQTLYAPQGENGRWIHRVKSGLGRASKNEFEVLQAVDRKLLLELDRQRKWRFNFDSHYELYIWDFVPGENPMELFHYLVDMLRRARRMREYRDMYFHQKHILEQLTQDEDTKRVRQIRAGEQTQSIYDSVTGPTARYAVQRSRGGEMRTIAHDELPEDSSMPYAMYNEADVVEDKVLFDGGRDQGLFTPIKNPLVIMESSPMTESMIRYGASLIDGADMEDSDEDEFDGHAGKKKALLSASDDTEAQHFIHSVPPIWRQAYFEINRNFGKHGKDREDMLKQGLQNFSSANTADAAWAWYCLDILDTLELRAWYDDYDQNPLSPWPHRYLAQDVTQAFVTMGLFFPDLEVTKLVREYLGSEQGSQFKNSQIFDPVTRSRKALDRRSRTSQSRKPESFFEELEELEECESMIDSYPFEWSKAVRPIIAKLYRAGIIQPSDTQPHPDVCPGYALAAEEPHRPGKLDFFVRFELPPDNPIRHPPEWAPVEDWPDLLASARAFARGKPGSARFSLLRLWSAPHFYPLMVGYWNRSHVVFMDSRGRSWEFKFVPKDLEGSELSAMHATSSRVKLVVERARMHSGVDLSKHFVSRGDAVLVMAESEEELLRLSTIVTFAMQTKPWPREVDLWRSFVNVELDFLQGLDPAWLD
ncbi:hypothetical protein INS49_012003 [Diaporthe citri]|uniref:uncharacterized protein n=1 Tax=Diaporthe citri TaxID=83186 RepID=UPI001C7F77E4|nr:uncharacterized protein INS49_012003 [Diaporthe citri]KAG6360935.1 hypothetical protein INS49_012003 [Diaporthe citri]